MKNTHRHRFAHYASSELVALALDLVFLWVLVTLVHMHYLLAAACAYILAAGIHYHTLRKHVFHGTTRDPFHLYTYFIAVGIAGFALNMVIMSLALKVHINYLFSRVFAALSVIPATYMLNSILTFVMPKPLPHIDEYCNIPGVENGN